MGAPKARKHKKSGEREIERKAAVDYGGKGGKAEREPILFPQLLKTAGKTQNVRKLWGCVGKVTHGAARALMAPWRREKSKGETSRVDFDGE